MCVQGEEALLKIHIIKVVIKIDNIWKVCVEGKISLPVVVSFVHYSNLWIFLLRHLPDVLYSALMSSNIG